VDGRASVTKDEEEQYKEQYKAMTQVRFMHTIALWHIFKHRVLKL